MVHQIKHESKWMEVGDYVVGVIQLTSRTYLVTSHGAIYEIERMPHGDLKTTHREVTLVE